MDPVSVASTYLDALVSREAESALLAPDVRRFHNGAVIVQGADEIRAILRREPLAGMGDRRWVVDGEHAIVFYDLHADMARATGSGGPPDTWIPAYVAERFLVRDEVVHEIDPIFFADVAKRPHPERPMRYPVGDDDRERCSASHSRTSPRWRAMTHRQSHWPTSCTASRTASTWGTADPRSVPHSRPTA